jgi:hypothetical protein
VVPAISSSGSSAELSRLFKAAPTRSRRSRPPWRLLPIVRALPHHFHHWTRRRCAGSKATFTARRADYSAAAATAQEAVTARLDDAAVMAGNFWIDHLGAKRVQSAERPFLVGFDQARVAGDIGRGIAANRRAH